MQHNLFAYCTNSSVNSADYFGYAVETVLDVASIIWSLIDLIAKPSWANLGYLIWDIASLIPFVPGSYVAKGGKLCIKVANKISDFSKGTKFLTGSYKKLKNVFLGIKNDGEIYIKSSTFKYFKYGSNYSKITYGQMEKAIKEVYKDMPQLLDETLKWFRKNWRKYFC